MQNKFWITRESCRAEYACYTDEQLEGHIPKEGLPPSAVLTSNIPSEDKCWVLIYAAGATDRILRESACWSARQLLASVKNPDPRSLHCVDVAERYARGEATEEELAEARKIAFDVSCDLPPPCIAIDAAWAACDVTVKNAATAAWATTYPAILEAKIKDLVQRLSEEEPAYAVICREYR
jgi:hypothetical protein